MTWQVSSAACALAVLVTVPARAEEPAPAPPRRMLILPDQTHGLPPGFHSETRPHYGPIIAGSVMTVMGAAFLGAGLQQRAQFEQTTTPQDPGSDGHGMMITGGAHLAIGLPILLYGLLSPREVYVRDPVVSVSLDVRSVRAANARIKFVF